MSNKRLRRVGVPEEFVDLLFSGGTKIISGLPDDTTVTDCYNEPQRQSFFFIVQSEEFEPVPEGEIIPQVTTDEDGFESYELELKEVE